jgi:hypothetical protein
MLLILAVHAIFNENTFYFVGRFFESGYLKRLPIYRK